jgi:CheY-like chemotaxis protein
MPRTILLADDSVTIRKVVELTFGDTDIRVESVASGRDALDKLRDLRPDLVLADVVMPGPSGYEVCRAVKASTRPVPVLLLTGTFEPFDAHEAKACGSDGHVTKPFDSRSLVERVEALLAGASVRLESAPLPAPDTTPEPAPVSAPEPARLSPREAVPQDELDALFDDLAGQPAGVAQPAPTPAHQAKPVAPPAPKAAPKPAPVAAVAPAPAVVKRGAKAARIAASPGPAPKAAAASRPEGGVTRLSEAEIDAVARAVVERLSDRVLREIAWDVIPDLAEVVLRERLRELERDDQETS